MDEDIVPLETFLVMWSSVYIKEKIGLRGMITLSKWILFLLCHIYHNEKMMAARATSQTWELKEKLQDFSRAAGEAKSKWCASLDLIQHQTDKGKGHSKKRC